MKKFITFLVVLTTFLSTSYGQGGSVKGTVKDADGLALIGATVQVENTNTAVVTDLDGNYVLSGVPSNATLVFSYVGMDSQSVAVAGKGVVDVTLQSDSSELEEVIIIGYGTTTKRKAVGAVSAIDSEKIEASTYNDMQSALQGQVPGLFVTSSGANMDDEAAVQIRGAEGEPLYVIDGVVSSASEFTMLNPADVESMSFLKDASATAVYGSKAGNGIVLVQTKSGSTGKTKVSYSGTFQISEPTMIPERVDTQTYMDLYNEVYMREYGTEYASQETIDAHQSNDWSSILFKNFAFQQKHNVGISGGTETTKYYATVGQFTNDGIMKMDGESLNRTNFRTNVVSEIDKLNITFNASVNASLQNTTALPSQAYSDAYYLVPPNITGYNPDGTVNNNTMNPLTNFSREVNESYVDKERNYLNGKVDLTWHPKSIKGLTVGVMAAYKQQNNFNRTWKAFNDLYNWDDETQTSSAVDNAAVNSLTVSSSYSKSVDFESRISYNRTFGKHTVEGLLLYTQRTGSGDWVSAGRSGYTVTALDELTVGPLTAVTTDGLQTMSGSQGLVFRAKYDYADKYIVEFSGRYDGNDDYADGYRWGFFPSVSAAWIVSDEAFMQPLVDNNIVSLVKLRGSYGQVGVSNDSDRYGYITGYEAGDSFFSINGTMQSTLQEGDLVDPANLSWYTRTSTDFGLDVGFLNNRFQFSGDYFYYETTGYTASPQDQYDVTLGTSFPKVITDTEHRREGFEFSLTYQNRFGDWDIAVGGNITKYKEIYAYDASEASSTTENPYRTLMQRDLSYANLIYNTQGFYASSSDFLNYAHTSTYAPEFGDLVYVDENGDGQITSQDMRYDEEPSSANLTYGVNFRVGWKDLSLSGLFQGTGTRMTYLGKFIGNGEVLYYTIAPQYDYWSEDNLDARFPSPSASTANQNNSFSDVYFEDAKYIRLKNLTLTYNMTRLMKNVNFIDTMSITLTGNNLLTWSPFFEWADPEGDLLTVDYLDTTTATKTCPTMSHSPIQRSYSVGINLTF